MASSILYPHFGQDVGSCLGVLQVDLLDEVRPADVELVVAAVDVDPAAIDLGAHGTVREEDPVVEGFEEVPGHRRLFLQVTSG